jgi:hypothetical protein
MAPYARSAFGGVCLNGFRHNPVAGYRATALMLNSMLHGMIAATSGLVLIAMCNDLQFVWGPGFIQ